MASHDYKPRPKEEKPRTDYGISERDFVEIWTDSSSVDEVARRTGMPKPIIFSRLSFYRKRGIKLKKIPRNIKKRLDVEGLNKLIEEIRKRNKP